jgi:glycosyltransferase involved in cell wall biosynthesis
MLKSVQDLYGRTRDMSAIPNGRDASHFYYSMEKKPFVASAGRLWDEAKNIASIERIAGELEWPVCLAGSTTPPSRAFAASRPNTCSSFGPLGREAFAQFLGRASIFCLPARYEPFGLSILDAALSGCALVIGDIPSLRENWEGAAVFVRPDSDCDIASALRELIADRRWRMELAAKARERALEFTPDRMASAYLQLYAELLANRGRLNEPAQAGTCAW